METTIHSTDPIELADSFHHMLQTLITQAREEQELITEPRFQALLETTAEVLQGLQTAFEHYKEGTETAWKR